MISYAAYGQDHVQVLAYFAALAPDEGKSVSDLARRHPGSRYLNT
ncbi:hypothetical protein [Streptomyces ipomoeae]|nr:hypothetical protein [Streptomyces ipomoeae]MDX2939220.1 hypothetical protein [Streptomyces ipomoeae]